MTEIKIKTVSGLEIKIKGNNYSFRDGVHYLSGGSYPDEIVVEVKEVKK